MKNFYKKIVVIVTVALIAGYNVYKSQSINGMSELMLMNVEALANTESTPCGDASHCYYLPSETCWIYVISGDHNQIVSSIPQHVHRGVH